MIVVLGYYGFGNLGDEAILAALCQDLVALGVKLQDIVVLSADPPRTAQEHGVRSLGRYNFAGIQRALSSARCFICGGGSLLQDVTSKRSLPYYLGVVELAFCKKVPVVMYGQGLGPLFWRVYQRWVRRAFLRSSGFTVRDEGSARFLQAWGVAGALGKISADPVFQWADLPGEDGSGAPRETLLLNLRPYPRWGQQRELWIRFVAERQEQGYVVEFIPLGPGDVELGRNLQGEVPGLLVHPVLTLENQSLIFKRASLCVSMRLHGLIFSAIHNVLPVGINYDPKIEAVSRQLDILYWEIDDLANLEAGVGISWKEYAGRLKRCQQATARLKQRAFRNREMLARVLGEG